MPYYSEATGPQKDFSHYYDEPTQNHQPSFSYYNKLS